MNTSYQWLPGESYFNGDRTQKPNVVAVLPPSSSTTFLVGVSVGVWMGSVCSIGLYTRTLDADGTLSAAVTSQLSQTNPPQTASATLQAQCVNPQDVLVGVGVSYQNGVLSGLLIWSRTLSATSGTLGSTVATAQAAGSIQPVTCNIAWSTEGNVPKDMLPTTLITGISLAATGGTMTMLEVATGVMATTSALFKNFSHNFANLFPSFKQMDKNNQAFNFPDQGANFRVWLPVPVWCSAPTAFKVQVKLDHIIGGGKDDHAWVTVAFDQHANYPATDPPSANYQEGDAAPVPAWVFSLTNTVLGVGGTAVSEVVGFFGTPVAAGVTKSVFGAIQQTTIACLELANVLGKFVRGQTEDGGGVYFAQLVAHTLNRLTTAGLECINNTPSEQTLRFSGTAYLKAMEDKATWNAKEGAAFQYSPPGKSSPIFRTWRQEVSINYDTVGLLVTCKIDATNDNAQDDHVVLVAVYNKQAALMLVQATLQLGAVGGGGPRVEIGTVTYGPVPGSPPAPEGQPPARRIIGISGQSVTDLSSTCNNLVQATQHRLAAAMGNLVGYTYSAEQKMIPDVVARNLTAMNAAVIPVTSGTPPS